MKEIVFDLLIHNSLSEITKLMEEGWMPIYDEVLDKWTIQKVSTYTITEMQIKRMVYKEINRLFREGY